jgi:histidinol-phosphatase
MSVPPGDVERYHAAALAMADEARRIVHPALQHGFRVETKRDGSVVTDVDHAVERRLREMIAVSFPDHGVIGEEYPPTRPDSPWQWILDPIDGTEEFVNGIPTWGAILALHHRGVPIVGVIDHPALDIRVNAAVGMGTYRNGVRVRLTDTPAEAPPQKIRVVMSARLNFARHVDEGALFDALARQFANHRIFRAAYAHTAAASGAVDVMVDMHNQVWDLAAAQVLIEEAGGRYEVVRDFVAADGGRRLGAVFGKPGAVDRLLAVFAQHPFPSR